MTHALNILGSQQYYYVRQLPESYFVFFGKLTFEIKKKIIIKNEFHSGFMCVKLHYLYIIYEKFMNDKLITDILENTDIIYYLNDNNI